MTGWMRPEVLRRIRKEDAKRSLREWLDADRRMEVCAHCGQMHPCRHTDMDSQTQQHSPRRAFA